ncbi:GntR family transcriptional regulator [Synechococcus sp. Nb3U1]|uniref:GntR family transcriptional regulator n=1 Tax=Synechococcus sp. Nb3U1 TaxID=1914529 RepID=UPI001F3E0FCA|nr:GntR family transcriptional regulator [Synechococcus sp. Nb3U1]MCF2971949.1 GntR family transcriptional regulator [Synechococcus sp. Nb3U1]
MSAALRSLPRKESLYEQTYQALREAVLSGRLAPGERLVETVLAEQLQVSRTPIREALRQLQREELLILGPSGGLHVPIFSEQDAAQLYDCRLALEHLSVMGSCQQASSSQLKKMQELVQQAEQLTSIPLAEQDPQALLDVDYRFHHLLAESSGNRWLVSLLDQVFDKMVLLRLQTTYHNPGVLEVRVEHRRIYEAIAQRDPILATQSMSEHLVASKARVIREVQHMRGTRV